MMNLTQALNAHMTLVAAGFTSKEAMLRIAPLMDLPTYVEFKKAVA